MGVGPDHEADQDRRVRRTPASECRRDCPGGIACRAVADHHVQKDDGRCGILERQSEVIDPAARVDHRVRTARP